MFAFMLTAALMGQMGIVEEAPAVPVVRQDEVHALVFYAAWCPGCPKIKDEMRATMTAKGWKVASTGHFEFVDVETNLGKKYWDSKDGGVPQVAILQNGRVVARFYGVVTGEDLDRKFRSVWR